MKRIIVLLTLIAIATAVNSQENDSVIVIIVGEFEKPKKYVVGYGEERIHLDIPKGYYGECFKFKILQVDRKDQFFYFNIGEIGKFGKYKDESVSIQLLDRRYLVAINDKRIRKRNYFNFFWIDEIDPSMFMPELYGILKKLKAECAL